MLHSFRSLRARNIGVRTFLSRHEVLIRPSARSPTTIYPSSPELKLENNCCRHIRFERGREISINDTNRTSVADRSRAAKSDDAGPPVIYYLNFLHCCKNLSLLTDAGREADVSPIDLRQIPIGGSVQFQAPPGPVQVIFRRIDCCGIRDMGTC